MSDNCPLCLDVISEASSILKCGHKFCSECILNSVALNTGTEEGTSRRLCPLCRVPMCEEVEPSEKNKIRMDDLKYELEAERITSERRKESLSILYDKITNIKDLFIKPAESALIGTKINVTKELEELVAILPDKRDINTETEYEAYPLVETDHPIESTNIVPYEPVRFTPLRPVRFTPLRPVRFASLPPFRFMPYEPFRLVPQPSIARINWIISGRNIDWQHYRLLEQLFSGNISYTWGWKRKQSERDRKRGKKFEMDRYLKYLNPLWSNKSDLMSTIYKIYATPQLIISVQIA
jgi:hypothetical protein